MEVQNDECLEEKEPATEMEVSPAEKIDNLRERAGYIRRRNTSIIALICILCLMFSWLTLVIYPQRKLNIARQLIDSGDYEEAYQLLSELADTDAVRDRKMDCIDALIDGGKYEEAFSRLLQLGEYDNIREKQNVCIDLMKSSRDYKAAYTSLQYLRDPTGMSRLKTEVANSLSIDDSDVSADDWEVTYILEKSIDSGYFRKGWQQQKDEYFLFSENVKGELVYTLLHYQEGQKSIEQRILDLGAEKADKGLHLNTEAGRAYVDKNGFIHAIGISFRGDKKFWLCTFNPSGGVERCSQIDAVRLNELSADAKGKLNFAVFSNGNIVCWNEKDPYENTFSGRAFVAVVKGGDVSEPDLIYEQTYSGETCDVRTTEKGNLLRVEKNEYGEDRKYTSIWKMDGVSGTKEIMLGNIPAPDDVCIVNGSNEEGLFISWNKALWEVKGPDEIKLILRYEEAEALKSGVVDVFRMTDGSWGFLTRAEEPQTSEYEKRDYYALIRVSAK